MKAVVFNQFGSPDVLHLADLPSPTPGVGEVLVEVVASTVNPTDLLMRSGAQAALMTELSPPYIAGMEFSGYVRATGEGVDIAAGTRVMGVVNPRTPRGGAYAQQIIVPAASVAELPAHVDLVAAATIPMNALTASMALDLSGVQSGQTLLVTGGTGMLGGLVLQLANERGITTLAAGREGDRNLLTNLGTDMILPRDGDLAEAVRSYRPDGVDSLVDCAVLGRTASSAVCDGGSAIGVRKANPIEDDRLNIGYVAVTNGMQDSATLRRIADLLATGRLTPRVAEGGVFAMGDAVAAHRMAEVGGYRGRVVIRFDQ